MPVKMVASRLYYHLPDRREYPAGAEFMVADETEADKLERRRKAMRANRGETARRPVHVDIGHPVRNDELAAARAEYETRVGKRPFNGWDIDELRQRMNSYLTRDMRAGE